jgi:hypothetical protein
VQVRGLSQSTWASFLLWFAWCRVRQIEMRPEGYRCKDSALDIFAACRRLRRWVGLLRSQRTNGV